MTTLYSEHKLLGVLLQDAHLISDVQVQVALVDQKAYQMRLGDILVLHGWLKKQTIDFFVEQWDKLLSNHHQYSLEYCLKAAGLLNQEQIAIAQQEESLTGQDFGTIAVEKGWLKPQTLNFFVNRIVNKASEDQSYPLAS